MDEVDNITLDDLQEIIQKKFLFYSKKLKARKIIFESINILSILLVFIGTLVGLLIHSDIILGVLNGLGLLIHSFLRLKNYPKKINFLSLISDQYHIIINTIVLYKRNNKDFDYSVLMNRVKIIDDLSSITLSSEELFLN